MPPKPRMLRKVPSKGGNIIGSATSNNSSSKDGGMPPPPDPKPPKAILEPEMDALSMCVRVRIGISSLL